MNLTDITSGSGDLAIDRIQELRGYVMRGSPVLLSPQAAAYALSCIESNGLINTELEALRVENARLRGAMAASDERLRVHGERVGLFFDCDNPEHMADEILALRAALAAAPRWVSVTERLPDTMRAFTVRVVGGYCLGDQPAGNERPPRPAYSSALNLIPHRLTYVLLPDVGTTAPAEVMPTVPTASFEAT